jgi:hypothetical protein
MIAPRFCVPFEGAVVPRRGSVVSPAADVLDAECIDWDVDDGGGVEVDVEVEVEVEFET